MPDYYGYEDPDAYIGSRMPTRRPISRPQSARMNRYVDAMQHRMVLRQIAADQDASLKQAQHLRELACDTTQQSLRRQGELKMVHIEASKERQQQLVEKRADKYCVSDVQKAKEREAKAKEREYYTQLNKRRVRQSERIWAALEQQRSARSHSGASQQQTDLMDERRAQLESVRLQKAENMERFLEAEDRRKGQQYAAGISKEIQRTRCRMLQLQNDRQAWQVACEDREITHPEHLIEKKLHEEATRLAGLSSELRAAVTQPRRQRPRSAMACRPLTGGITVFSSDTPRRAASIYSDATDLGPRITVVDPRW